MPEKTSKIGYRADIDGLRAIAVLSVLLYHYRAPLPFFPFPGAFSGVDVFFVISGFLITSILTEEIRNDRFSVLGFYDRRIRRILPALAVVLVATLLAGRFILMPGDYVSLAASTAAAAFGASNFYFLGHTGYFDQSAELLPLLHTWSLAVEEQFYLLWPLLLLVIVKGRSRIRAAALCAGLTIIGFAACLFWVDQAPKEAFYMALPRAWELSIGASLVFLPQLRRTLSEGATIAGLALIVTGFIVIDAKSFPGPTALLPCVGAALVIWPRQDTARSAKALGLLAPVGLISYSLYLWHWPVWVLFRVYINGAQPRIREAAALAVVSIALATASYLFVERPFRKPRWSAASSVAAGLATCMTIICGAMFIHSADGLPERVPDAYDLRSLDAMWEWPCPRQIRIEPLGVVCNFGADWNTAKRHFLLWGDSHADTMAPLLAAALAPKDDIAVLVYFRCPAFIHDSIRSASQTPDYMRICNDSYQGAAQFIRSTRLDGIILASFWTGHLDLLSDNATAAGNHNAGLNLTRIGLLAFNDEFSRFAPITIVGDVPQFATATDPVSCAITGALLRRSCTKPSISRKEFEQRQGDTYAILRDVAAQRSGVHLILPGDSLCHSSTCLTELDGHFLYRDYNHIRRNLPTYIQATLAGIIGLRRVFATADHVAG